MEKLDVVNEFNNDALKPIDDKDGNKQKIRKKKKERKKRRRSGIDDENRNELNDASRPTKKTRKSSKVKNTHLENEAKEIEISNFSLEPSSSSFQVRRLKMIVSLLPNSMSNVRGHIRRSLRKNILRYSHGIGGVLLALSNVSFEKENSSGKILNELPHIHFQIICDALVFCPEIGMKLTGVVNESFPSHLGILVHTLFNAMIPAEHLQRAGYIYDRSMREWCNKGASVDDDDSESPLPQHEVIKVGGSVCFMIDKVHECAGVISLEGQNPSIL
eukprot:CAMPEP_0194424138 /NCGR_PEP_ID=MMETSP0176-20130528/23408_1 /TAXON_ID=216777 /ORGANISM="Proboscia alata, Strain PI-D3" /LENGTH=273 /DNA_ID=CAMNT_0039233735 /DNA_START=55 /DNA_END=876 /DNA_ORIENTATION=-